MSTDAVQMCCEIQPFLKIIKIIIALIQWSVPLILIVFGSFDMFKAVASGDEKVTSEVRSIFIKRVSYGIAVFLVPFFIELILNFVNSNFLHNNNSFNNGDLSDASSWIDCWNGKVSCKSNSNQNTSLPNYSGE